MIASLNYFHYDMELKMKKIEKRPLVLAFLAGFLLFYCSTVSAKTDSSIDKNQDILKLLEVSGLLDQMNYIKEGVTNSYARVISLTYPKVPNQFWDDFNKLVGKEEMKVLLDQVVLVYDKHMTHDVIKKLIKMFSTPFWIEWKQKMPTISKEAGLVGSQWTQEIMQSELFKNKLDNLVRKYDLENFNSTPEKTNLKK
ncbi:uncharacterized protein METZ01_LOCUS123351 [marine metagenome]|uniref:DUF2059 domain-containing protein n=1 Tax=marine metagenome TaxID=408172 RepID=A0A381Y256_9ZZZZ